MQALAHHADGRRGPCWIQPTKLEGRIIIVFFKFIYWEEVKIVLCGKSSILTPKFPSTLGGSEDRTLWEK